MMVIWACILYSQKINIDKILPSYKNWTSQSIIEFQETPTNKKAVGTVVSD